jgi:putative hydrolase of the HAD superfamily
VTPPIDAVLLDVGGVLTLPEPTIVRSAVEPFGISPDEDTLDRAHFRAVHAADRRPSSADDAYRNAYLRTYVLALGVPSKNAAAAAESLDEAFAESEDAWSRIAPGAAEGLRAICRTGARVALVSNTLHGRVEAGLLRLGLCQVGPGPGNDVVAIIDSTRVGMAKPDPRIFRLGLDAVGTPPERAIFVGDSIRNDVGGAKAVGMVALHLDPFGMCSGRGHDDVPALRQVAQRVVDLQ